MSVPRLVGTASSVVSGTTVVVTLTDNVPAGEHLVAAWGIDGDKSFTAASDSKANTWQTDITRRDATRNIAAALCSAKVTNALVIGDTVTFTQQSGAVTNERHAAVWGVQGLKATGWVERVLDPGSSASFSSWSGQLDRAHMTSQANTLIAGVSIFGQAGTNGYIPGGMWDEANLTSGSGRVLAGVKAATWRDYYDWLAVTGGGSLPSTIPLMVVYLDAVPGTDTAVPVLNVSPSYGSGGLSWLADAYQDAPRRDGIGIIYLDAGTYSPGNLVSGGNVSSLRIERHGTLHIRPKPGVAPSEIVIATNGDEWELNLKDCVISGLHVGQPEEDAPGRLGTWGVSGQRIQVLGCKLYGQLETLYGTEDLMVDRLSVGNGRAEDRTTGRLDVAPTTTVGSQSASGSTIAVASSAGFLNPFAGTDASFARAELLIAGNVIRYTNVSGNTFTGCTLSSGPGGTIPAASAVSSLNTSLWPLNAIYFKGANGEKLNKRLTARRVIARNICSTGSEVNWADDVELDGLDIDGIYQNANGNHTNGVRVEGHVTNLRWRRIRLHNTNSTGFFIKDHSTPGYYADFLIENSSIGMNVGVGQPLDWFSIRGIKVINTTISENSCQINSGFNIVFFNCTINNLNASGASAFQHDYNRFGTLSGATYGPNEVTAAPTYVDQAAGDLRLQSGSAGINSGTLEYLGIKAPVLDYDRLPRPFGAAPDLGAHERQTA